MLCDIIQQKMSYNKEYYKKACPRLHDKMFRFRIKKQKLSAPNQNYFSYWNVNAFVSKRYFGNIRTKLKNKQCDLFCISYYDFSCTILYT